MSDTTLLVIVGTIWIAPHIEKRTGMLLGTVVLTCAAIIGIFK
jgi:hypothetical protein